MKLLTTEYTENILNIEGYKFVAPEKGVVKELCALWFFGGKRVKIEKNSHLHYSIFTDQCKTNYLNKLRHKRTS